jgi:hypothetical protein
MHNGRNLEGWTPYFARTGLQNTDSTFQFTPEGDLYVNQRQSKSTTGFGHLFYTRKKLSYYMARARYRFTTETTASGFTPSADQPQNNGFMIHSQDPATMNGKDFPMSAECQLLGPKNALFLRPAQGYPVGTTANLCVSGIQATLNGSSVSGGCHQPAYPAAWRNTNIPWEDPQGWSDILIRVLGDSLIQHFVHGVKVLEYSRIRANGGPLREGYLAIQAEGSSTIFKDFAYVELTGCMDPTKPGYRTYYVKDDPSRCAPTGAGPGSGSRAAPGVIREGAVLVVRGDAVIAGILRADGTRLAVRPGSRGFRPDRAGIYWITLQGPAGSIVRSVAWH